MGRVYIGRTHEDGRGEVRPGAGRADDPDRERAQAFIGDPAEIAEQVQAYLDAGLDGITFSMPDVYDLESVALAGETLSAVIGTKTA